MPDRKSLVAWVITLLLNGVTSRFTLAGTENDFDHLRYSGKNYRQFYHFDKPVFDGGADTEICEPEFENSVIYCKGPILEAVNYHRIFNDSKDFVDSSLKRKPAEIVNAFKKQFGNTPIDKINVNDLRQFYDNNFHVPESELVMCTPTDWTENPEKIARIQDPVLRKWAFDLNEIWRTLCRKIDVKIGSEQDRHSILYVSHPFIIPGGRFREFYYWDTYWIIKGLLVSNMFHTTREMILNMVEMVDRLGFVPNGNRVYYTKRSQPPTLTAAVYQYYEASDDLEFVKKVLPALETEFLWWQQNRLEDFVVDGEHVQAYFYASRTSVPRPESLRADLESARGMTTDQQKFFFRAAASAAESGWDFSSRWFADRKTLATIETQHIAPVDLNSFICYNMDILGYLFEVTGKTVKAKKYQEMFAEFRRVHERIFYNETEGAWYDFNVRTGTHNIATYPSMATPLFTGCYNRLDEGKSKRFFEKLEREKFFDFPGGVPTSMVRDTLQQWDFPNGWSPLNHIIIEGLRKSTDPVMQDRAFELAKKWITGNFRVYNNTKNMFEKYDVIGNVPKPGHGGEYEVQTGFGWSNGVVLDLLTMYYDRIQMNDQGPQKAASRVVTHECDITLAGLALLNLFYQLT